MYTNKMSLCDFSSPIGEKSSMIRTTKYEWQSNKFIDFELPLQRISKAM